ncbi:MAG: 9-O-acetylesterase, partial [Verrucomicrobiae bacterium]|nr:9-O-acetylesterase [Verrucomicrobiae bacterium]
RGAIWYQGESNHVEGMAYFDKKKSLLAGWRKLWGIGEFPFYFVQIAPYQYGDEDPAILPRFWEAQSACLEIPGTGMVVTNDIGNPTDIHPKNKQEVGHRLALLALKHTYGKSDLVASGPRFDSMKVEGDRVTLRFENVAGGLKTRDGQAPSHFEIIGEQAAFVPAQATIEGGDTVVLSSPEVKEPAAMRFAWDKLAEPNLVNGAGLPTSAFRAGEVPNYDFFSLKVDEAGDYELIYDLDLKKLGAELKYEVDRAAQLDAAFDRVGYFLELNRDGKLQWLWIAMDPFTDDASKLGIPTPASGAVFQQAVKNVRVLSNAEGIPSGDGLAVNLEFWPHNYGPLNAAKVPGASDQAWDIGDERVDPVGGYGSMQIHLTAAKQTLMAINHWSAGPGADIGIGNSTGQTLDWTFAGNAGSYEAARLRVLVRKSAK